MPEQPSQGPENRSRPPEISELAAGRYRQTPTGFEAIAEEESPAVYYLKADGASELIPVTDYRHQIEGRFENINKIGESRADWSARLRQKPGEPEKPKPKTAPSEAETKPEITEVPPLKGGMRLIRSGGDAWRITRIHEGKNGKKVNLISEDGKQRESLSYKTLVEQLGMVGSPWSFDTPKAQPKASEEKPPEPTVPGPEPAKVEDQPQPELEPNAGAGDWKAALGSYVSKVEEYIEGVDEEEWSKSDWYEKLADIIKKLDEFNSDLTDKSEFDSQAAAVLAPLLEQLDVIGPSASGDDEPEFEEIYDLYNQLEEALDQQGLRAEGEHGAVHYRWEPGVAADAQPEAEGSPEVRAQVQLESFAVTEGKERPGRNNEDASLQHPEWGLFGAFDGLGGHGGGDMASGLAVEAVERLYRDEGQVTPDQEISLIVEALSLADHSIKQQRAALHNTMATTAALFRVFADTEGRINAAVGHMGDSRIVRLHKNGQLEQVTQDDSPYLDSSDPRAAQMRLSQATSSSQLDDKDKLAWERRHIVSEALGELGVDSRINTQRLTDLEPGELLVALSDGITDNLTHDEIAEALRGAENPEAAARILLIAAKLRAEDGTHGRAKEDDMTAVVVRIGDLIQPSAAAAKPESVFGKLGTVASLTQQVKRPRGADAVYNRLSRAGLVRKVVHDGVSSIEPIDDPDVQAVFSAIQEAWKTRQTDEREGKASEKPKRKRRSAKKPEEKQT